MQIRDARKSKNKIHKDSKILTLALKFYMWAPTRTLTPTPTPGYSNSSSKTIYIQYFLTIVILHSHVTLWKSVNNDVSCFSLIEFIYYDNKWDLKAFFESSYLTTLSTLVRESVHHIHNYFVVVLNFCLYHSIVLELVMKMKVIFSKLDIKAKLYH